MQEFEYQALDKSGKRVGGHLLAWDAHQAVKLLGEHGLTVFRIEPVKRKTDFPFSEWAPVAFPLPVLSHFTREFASLLKAGFDPHSGLKMLEETSSHPILRRALHSINAGLAGSVGTLAQLLREHRRVFPPLYANLVESAETGGFLERTLFDLADFYDREIELRKQLSSSTVYSKATFVVFLFSAYILYHLNFIPFFLFGIGLLGSGVYLGYLFLSRTRWGHYFIHGIALFLPGIGNLYRNIALSRYFRILGLQLNAGTPLMDALEMAGRASGDFHIEHATQKMIQNLHSGNTLQEAFRSSKFFSKSDVGMIAVGEEAGETGQMVDKLSSYYSLQAQTLAKALVSMVPALMTLILGALVLILALYFWSGYFQKIFSAVGE